MNKLKKVLSTIVMTATAFSVNALEISPMSVGGENVTDSSKSKFYVQVHQSTASGSSFCGASIIDSKHILTAAHCVDQADGSSADDPSNVTIIVGGYERPYFYEDEFKKVKTIHVHENWDESDMFDGWDIAILELESPITDNVSSITLPTSTELSDAYLASDVVLFGMGIDETRITANKLQETDMYLVPVLSHSAYGCSLNVGAEDKILCTSSIDYGNGDKGTTCSGDSGGPLTYLTNDGDYQQIGIVSYGSPDWLCGADNTSQFTNLQYFVNSGWIASKITSSGVALTFDPSLDDCVYGDGDDANWKQNAAVCEFEGTNPPETSVGDSGGSGGSTGLLTLLGLGLLTLRRKQ